MRHGRLNKQQNTCNKFLGENRKNLDILIKLGMNIFLELKTSYRLKNHIQ